MNVQPTIAEVKDLQARLNMKDVHVVYLDDLGFVMAHTDKERATIVLSDCELHLWLEENGPPEEFEEDGYYVVRRREHDPTSESFRSGASPWNFEKIEVAA